MAPHSSFHCRAADAASAPPPRRLRGGEYVESDFEAMSGAERRNQTGGRRAPLPLPLPEETGRSLLFGETAKPHIEFVVDNLVVAGLANGTLAISNA